MIRANILIFDKGGIWMGGFSSSFLYKTAHFIYLCIIERRYKQYELKLPYRR